MLQNYRVSRKMRIGMFGDTSGDMARILRQYSCEYIFGLDFKRKTVSCEDIDLTLNIFDLPFQLLSNVLHGLQIKRSGAFMVIVNTCDKSSIVNAENLLTKIHTHFPDEKPPCILVETLPQGHLNMEICSLDIKNLAEKFGISYMSVDPDDSIGVEEAFQRLIDCSMQSGLFGSRQERFREAQIERRKKWDERLRYTLLHRRLDCQNQLKDLAGDCKDKVETDVFFSAYPVPLQSLIMEYLSGEQGMALQFFFQRSLRKAFDACVFSKSFDLVTEEEFKQKFDDNYTVGKMGGHWAPMFGRKPVFNLLSVVEYAAEKPGSETAKALDAIEGGSAAGPAAAAAAP